MEENKSLISYENMEQEWGREIHTDRCNSAERTGLVWVSVGLWNVRGKMMDAEKERCLLCKDGENTYY
jgi:hypothetical protein